MLTYRWYIHTPKVYILVYLPTLQYEPGMIAVIIPVVTIYHGNILSWMTRWRKACRYDVLILKRTPAAGSFYNCRQVVCVAGWRTLATGNSCTRSLFGRHRNNELESLCRTKYSCELDDWTSPAITRCRYLGDQVLRSCGGPLSDHLGFRVDGNVYLVRGTNSPWDHLLRKRSTATHGALNPLTW